VATVTTFERLLQLTTQTLPCNVSEPLQEVQVMLEPLHVEQLVLQLRHWLLKLYVPEGQLERHYQLDRL